METLPYICIAVCCELAATVSLYSAIRSLKDNMIFMFSVELILTVTFLAVMIASGIKVWWW